MAKKLAIIACFVSLFLTVQSYSPAQNLDSLKASLERIVEQEMNQWNWTGVSVAVVYQNEIIMNKGFGFANIENNILMTRNTILPIASLTKTFTATMFMQLIEKELVEFNSNVNNFIPEYKPTPDHPDYGNTTLLQLATHSAGLPKESPALFWSHFEDFLWIISNGNFQKQSRINREDYLQSLFSVHLESMPNAHFIYSNVGYTLLGMTLEKASGLSYQEYIKKNIFKPLKMNNSGFYQDFITAQNQAICYVFLPQNPQPLVAPTDARNRLS